MTISLPSVACREQIHARLDQILDSLPASVGDAAEAETHLRREMLALGRDALQRWADGAHQGDGAPACKSCGETMRHRGCPEVTLTTTLGDVRVKRPRRCCEVCQTNVYPHDENIRFQSHGVSWPLARLISRYASGNTYAESRDLLQEDYSVRLSKETFERVVQTGGAILLEQDDQQRKNFFAMPAQQQQQTLDDNTVEADMLAVAVDGTMLHAEGEFQEIRVGRVMNYDRDNETIEQKKSFARFLSVEEVGRQLFLDAHEAGYRKAKERVFLGDGARWIWDIAAVHFPEAVQILDWYHLAEKVHEVAATVWGADEERREEWLDEIKSDLWEGRMGEAKRSISDLRKTLRSKAKREALRTLHVYLENNRDRMKYAEYQAAGYPVGSGMVESHCKRVVNQRCKHSGMRNWNKHKAEYVLRFRAARIDKEFDHLWSNKLKIAA